MFETYAQMKERQQKEFNEFPMMFAFSNEQFKEGCARLGVTDPKAELYRAPGGGFYRKSDAPRLHELTDRHAREMSEAMKVEEFAVGAYCYEAANHEYQINWDPDFDMALCFGLPYDRRENRIMWEKVPDGETQAGYYIKGVQKHLKWCREHNAY